MSKLNPLSYFNPDFDMNDIKIVYIPPKNKHFPVIHESLYKLHIPTEAQKFIDESWVQECAKKMRPNEILANVRFINIENGDLEIAPEEYKIWKITAQKEFCDKFGNNFVPNPLNVQSLIQTSDKQLILGPHPERGTLQLPGGMINIRTDRKNGKISLTKGAVREFQEEIGLIPISNMRLLGTSFYAGRVLSTVFMTGKINISAKQLEIWRSKNINKIKDYKDFPKLEFIKANKSNIEKAIQTKKIQETTLIALLLLGAQNFGHKWLCKTCAPKMLAFHLQFGHTRE